MTRPDPDAVAVIHVAGLMRELDEHLDELEEMLSTLRGKDRQRCKGAIAMLATIQADILDACNDAV